MPLQSVHSTPALGPSDARVEPLRRMEDVASIRKFLKGRLRDLTLISLGVNNALRAGDLLRLSVNQVRDIEPGGIVEIAEKRTGLRSLLSIPPRTHGVLQRYLQELSPPGPPGNMYLFAPHPGWSPLSTAGLDALVRECTLAIGLRGNHGAHTLRKTFGYLQHTHYGVALEVLARRYHHDSPLATKRYLGLNGEGSAEPFLQEI